MPLISFIANVTVLLAKGEIFRSYDVQKKGNLSDRIKMSGKNGIKFRFSM